MLRPTEKPTEEERRKLESDAMVREVDEAFRQDQALDMMRKYGKPVGIVLVLALALFGGYLLWQSQHEGNLEKHSEELVKALDAIDAGNFDTAAPTLAKLEEEGSDGQRTAARLLQAGVALRQGNEAAAAKIFGEVRADGDAPQAYRDLATIREVAVSFDTMDKAVVVERLKPLAVPGKPWFGSAGELLAMAYLEQGKRDLAGPLLAKISQDEDVPQSLRSRARQMAGVMGVDAVEDVDATLAEIATDSEAGAPAPQ